uniref:Uncharacterized protein n=1 Tax=Labrus bergylta TaxID=56723 RepID=A0A3Q3G3V4_9LABR
MVDSASIHRGTLAVKRAWARHRLPSVSAPLESPTVVHPTTVNIVTEPPKDHIIWSLCCFVYSNPFYLGLLALIYSIKSRDRKMVGDLEGARQYGRTACTFNIKAGLPFVVPLVVCELFCSGHTVLCTGLLPYCLQQSSSHWPSAHSRFVLCLDVVSFHDSVLG